MARAFTDEERDALQARLIEAGRALFGQYGLRKTSISDLAGAVGIAPSTFYQFFPSKEVLFLTVVAQDRAATQAQVMARSFEAHADPEDAIVAYLRVTLELIESNPLARRLLDPAEYQALTARLTPEQVARQRADSVDPVRPYIEAFQARGLLVDDPPEVIGGAIRSLVFLALHREEIGAEQYPQALDLLIRAVAAGLTRRDGS